MRRLSIWGGLVLCGGLCGCMAQAPMRLDPAARQHLLGTREHDVLVTQGQPDAIDFVHWPAGDRERAAALLERWTYCDESVEGCEQRLEVYLRDGTVWATKAVEAETPGSAGL